MNLCDSCKKWEGCELIKHGGIVRVESCHQAELVTRADLAAREAEIARLDGDSSHLQACIAEFERLKSAVMDNAKIPVILRTRDALYLDGVLAVLTTRKATEGAKP